MRNKIRNMPLICALLLLLPGVTLSQRAQPARTFTISGQTGQANTIEVGGRSYVEIEGLTQITRGSLSFEANRIVLSLPTSTAGASATGRPAEPPHSSAVNPGLSRDFMRAGIEEFATMREWASTLANAIQNGYPVTDEWAANYREQAAHNLRLASAAASTEDDKKALQLLTNEFDAIRQWSNKLVQEKKSMDTAKYAMSPDTLRADPSSQKIITCGQFLATMLGSSTFQDDPSCH